MPSFESIINEGDWVGEHFLTSDGKASFSSRVAERTKHWREQESSPLTRFSASRGTIETALQGFGEQGLNAQSSSGRGLSEYSADADATESLHRLYLETLGYTGAGYSLSESGHVTRVGSPGLGDAAPLAIVSARPADAIEDLRDKGRDGLWSPFEGSDGKESLSLPGLVSQLFAEPDGPTFVLVLAGRWALLTESARWAEGRFLGVDLQLVSERNDAKRGGEIETALSILSADSLAPDAEGNIWWTGVIEDSVKHTVGVSKDLREGVRLSIEIIANDVVSRRALKGLDPLPPSEAQPLAMQSLRYLYRILFLLYAEASPELGVLPTGTDEYDTGYSLDRLRELILTDLTSQKSTEGTHLYDSLGVLFTLVDQGHSPAKRSEDSGNDSLTFGSLRADLFLPKAIGHISAVGLSNGALKDVLERLLLTKKQKRQDRGFISYAELGINQLGAVYEGLMSYTGFFAQEDLYEVAKNGDASKGSWVVPTHRADGISSADFVTSEDLKTGEMRPVIHPAGTFVYRLAGRERQQSASFYTPEVLTRFTVKQALEELLDQEGGVTTAEEILSLTVCEPALGSGAFAIEATRQLAAEYLKRRQKETGKDIPPEDYQRELQRVKAYIALHNVYGVDLNGTAVELAEISLWLDTMVEDLKAPWFGLHLRRGNSLIGARRAVYSRDTVNSKAWLKQPPKDIPVAELLENAAQGKVAGQISGQIFHFLLPAEGWGAASDSKEAKALTPEATKALKDWQRSIHRKPTRKQLDDLQELTYRVEALWQMAARRLRIANDQTRRGIDVWGREATEQVAVVSREQIEGSLADANSAYRRVRTVMDAWCALWFWPIESEVAPPSLDEWIATCFSLLGRAPEARLRGNFATDTLGSTDSWEELDQAELTDLGLAGAVTFEATVEKSPWLGIAVAGSTDQGFFHWQFEYPQVFALGGFDLQVGNPPWVHPTFSENLELAEFDPWWQLKGDVPASALRARRELALTDVAVQQHLVEEESKMLATRQFLTAVAYFPLRGGGSPDLYRSFMEISWRNARQIGVSSLIHMDSHFTDEKSGALRRATYNRLKRHFHFINEFHLFEIQNQRMFSVNTYAHPRRHVNFLHAVRLYHPSTVERSLSHDGSGPAPGSTDTLGNFDASPHASRISVVTDETLSIWAGVSSVNDGDMAAPKMLYVSNAELTDAISKTVGSPTLLDLNPRLDSGIGGEAALLPGARVEYARSHSWTETLLDGSHIGVSCPTFKWPIKGASNPQHWKLEDLESLPVPYGHVSAVKLHARSSSEPSDRYRVAWRRMAAPTGERTLFATILPPGSKHSDGITSAEFKQIRDHDILVAVGTLSSLLIDFRERVSGKANLQPSSVLGTRALFDSKVASNIALRAARLNCLTADFSDLWAAAWSDRWAAVEWKSEDRPGRAASELGATSAMWKREYGLTRADDRRQALLENDVLVAIGLGVSIDALCLAYRDNFGVLKRYDLAHHYDANGRLVPKEVLKLYKIKGDHLTPEERTSAYLGSGVDYTYEFPFEILDREQDMRDAYASFEQEFGHSE
jgi:hypothetical protein